jgi:hypothetical protein
VLTFHPRRTTALAVALAPVVFLVSGCGGGAPPGQTEAAPAQRQQRLHEEERSDTIDIKKKLLGHE